MKITASQLKKIIAEEISKIRMDEAVSPGPVGSAELQTMLDVVCDDWKSQFDSDDPVMYSKAVWDDQCDEACDVLGEKIQELILQFGNDLHDGKFYKG